MRRVLKKMTALLLLSVMIFSFSTSASAATYPTATRLTAANITCKRGNSVKMRFKLRSNSYTKYENTWRSKFFIKIYSPGGGVIASKAMYFSGTLTQEVTWKTTNKIPKGVYSVNYFTLYNSNIYSYKWYSNSSTTNKWCYIRVK